MDVYTLNLQSMMQAMDILRLAHKNGIDPEAALRNAAQGLISNILQYEQGRITP